MKFGQGRVWAGVGQQDGALGLAWMGVPGFSYRASRCTRFWPLLMLDVLTPLSDCRQESVEKMERRISGGLYMCWMDFHNEILCCGFLCARLISFSFVFYLVSFPATTLRATTPHLYCTGYHAQGYHAFTTTCLLYTSPSPRD